MATMQILSLMLLSILASTEVRASDVPTTLVNETELGNIRGYTEEVLGKTINTYLGIPYAKPPTGDLRFKPPEPYGSWEDTLDATELPNSCPQLEDTAFEDFEGSMMWNPNTELSEDCLYLNIWSPSGLPSNPSGRAVMVWIYGGGFYSGTSTLPIYDGRILAALGDVVVVSMQYRLGVTGFLYLGTPEIPGNMGLLDQVMALQWVQDNIECYYGDPNRVTIFGESAGAVSVGLHLLSPMSRDLFNQAILESAAPTHYNVKSAQEAMETSLAIAAAVGCEGDDLQRVRDCLVDVPIQNLLENMHGHASDFLSNLILVPLSVDGHFLPKLPMDLLNEKSFKRANILLGVNSNEGAYFLPYILPDVYTLKGVTISSEETFTESVAKLIDAEASDIITRTVAFEYSQPYHYAAEPGYPEILDSILGDRIFTCAVVNLAKTYATEGENVYFYKFTEDLSSNPWPNWMGVLHGYEIDAVFGMPLNISLTYTDEERLLGERMALHWVNFANNGEPSLKSGAQPYEWPTYTMDDRNVLVLNITTPAVVIDGFKDRECEFWEKLVPQLRKADANAAVGQVSSMFVSLVAILTLLSGQSMS